MAPRFAGELSSLLARGGTDGCRDARGAGRGAAGGTFLVMFRKLTLRFTRLPHLFQDVIMTILSVSPILVRYLVQDGGDLDLYLLAAVFVMLLFYIARRHIGDMKDDRERVLTLLGQIAELSKFPNETGVMIFSPFTSLWQERKLKARLAHNKMGFSDEFIEFPLYSGCTGHCWSERKQIIADLGHEDVVLECEMLWNMDSKQIADTKHIKAVCSTPIRDPDGTIIAVLAIDCLRSAHDSGMVSAHFLESVSLYAERLGRIIKTHPLL